MAEDLFFDACNFCFLLLCFWFYYFCHVFSL